MGLRIVMLLILPAAVGLLVLASPLIALVFEHGAFEPYDTVRTAQALRLYLIGLPFAAEMVRRTGVPMPTSTTSGRSARIASRTPAVSPSER